MRDFAMTSIWKHTPTLEQLQANARNTAIATLGIEYTAIGDNWMQARMPVDHRTHQPAGLLHGGASVVLAETLGSTGAMLCIDADKYQCLGLEINANHLRGVASGWVIGTAEPLHIGSTTHIWSIRIENEEGKLVCISRLTMAIKERQRPQRR
jgi:1,4-dihydroxy-2-naphthoyl-CoA hydrolase